jgi:hypothetical protein
MARGRKHLLSGSLLDNSAEIHNRHPMRHLPNNPEIVRYEKVANSEVALDLL